MAGLGMATGSAKRDAVAALVKKLTDDLEHVSLLPQDRNTALEELKIYGRDPKNADPIFTREGISMLLRHAFHSPSSETARAALRVIANAMLLKPQTRQFFVDEGFPPRACSELKSENWDDEFLLSRILFLITYETNVDLKELIEKHQLAERIVENVGRHAKLLSNRSKAKAEPMEEMALLDTLKLLFNIAHHCPSHVAELTPAVPHLVPLLWKQDPSTNKPLDPPLGAIINALSTLDLGAEKSKAALFPKGEPDKVAVRLVDILGLSMKAYGDKDLDPVVSPLVSIILSIFEHAPESTKQHIRKFLLPTSKDREDILGKGNTLSAKILKNSTNPLAPGFREVSSHLLFNMSDKDASKFVENVGYGFASGFLFQNNIPVPASASEAFSTGDKAGDQKPVNPITGQFVDNEKPVDMPEMTQEEKEREAERLFVLFERLKQTGVVDIQNPVEQAVREGRYRELKDDEVEELE